VVFFRTLRHLRQAFLAYIVVFGHASTVGGNFAIANFANWKVFGFISHFDHDDTSLIYMEIKKKALL